MNREQAVLRLVEPIKFLVARRLGQLAVESVRPTMVLASENLGRALISRYDWKCPMSANIVEGIDLPLTISSKHELEASDLELEPVSRLAESDLMGDELPFPREDGPSFELVHLLGRVPI